MDTIVPRELASAYQHLRHAAQAAAVETPRAQAILNDLALSVADMLAAEHPHVEHE